MSDVKIELVVLDAHGVVFNNPLRGFLAELARLTGQEEREVLKRWDGELRTVAWSGGLEDQELWVALCGERGRHSHDWSSRLESLYEVGPAAPHLDFWSKRAPLWLLSNHRSHWLEPRLRRFGLSRYFERILVSDAIGAAKPTVQAFHPILQHVGSPRAALFIDDQARNVKAARALGIVGLEVNGQGRWVEAVNRRLNAPGHLV